MKVRMGRRDGTILKLVVFVIFGILVCFFCGVFVGQALTPSSDLSDGGVKLRGRKSVYAPSEGFILPVEARTGWEEVSERPSSPQVDVRGNIAQPIHDNTRSSVPKPGSSLYFDAFSYASLPASIDSEDVMISGNPCRLSLYLLY